LNEPFGDTVHWDTLPAAAIASINVIPGSNPLFGLNALGGALSIRTKDGFGFPGVRAAVRTGSWGRHQADRETGGRSGSFAYFVSGSLTDEAGWRDRHQLTTRLALVGQVQNVFDAGYHTFGVLGEADLLGEAFEDESRFQSPGAPRAGWVGLEVRF
jgi:outer membrane cobalamin receptor